MTSATENISLILNGQIKERAVYQNGNLVGKSFFLSTAKQAKQRKQILIIQKTFGRKKTSRIC